MSQMIPLPEDSPTVEVRLAGRAFGISATTSYARAATGELVPGLPVFKIGAKYRVSTSALRRVLGLDDAPADDATADEPPADDAAPDDAPATTARTVPTVHYDASADDASDDSPDAA